MRRTAHLGVGSTTQPDRQTRAARFGGGAPTAPGTARTIVRLRASPAPVGTSRGQRRRSLFMGPSAAGRQPIRTRCRAGGAVRRAGRDGDGPAPSARRDRSISSAPVKESAADYRWPYRTAARRAYVTVSHPQRSGRRDQGSSHVPALPFARRTHTPRAELAGYPIDGTAGPGRCWRLWPESLIMCAAIARRGTGGRRTTRARACACGRRPSRPGASGMSPGRSRRAAR
jgi:hypothetical protein